MNLFDIGLSILIPSIITLIILAIIILPAMYREDWDYDDDYIETPKDKFVFNCLRCSLATCCLSSYIFAYDFYVKEAYWLSLLCFMGPIYVFWDYWKK